MVMPDDNTRGIHAQDESSGVLFPAALGCFAGLSTGRHWFSARAIQRTSTLLLSVDSGQKLSRIDLTIKTFTMAFFLTAKEGPRQLSL